MDEHWKSLLASALLVTGIGVCAVARERRDGRIPNGLTLGGALAAVLVRALCGDGIDAALGCLVGLAIGLLVWWPDLLSGGGVKLAAALGACVGPLPILGAWALAAGYVVVLSRRTTTPTEVRSSPIALIATVIALAAEAAVWGARMSP